MRCEMPLLLHSGKPGPLNYGMMGLHCGTSESLNCGMLSSLNLGNETVMILAVLLALYEFFRDRLENFPALYEFFRDGLGKSLYSRTPDTRYRKNRMDNKKQVAGLRKSATSLPQHKESSQKPAERTHRHNHRTEPQAAVLGYLHSGAAAAELVLAAQQQSACRVIQWKRLLRC